MSPWTDRLDSKGHPHHCTHRDGHKVALFPGGWWAYHKDYRYTRRKQPRIGPEPEGPFKTLHDAKNFVETQGWVSQIPFEFTPQAGRGCQP